MLMLWKREITVHQINMWDEKRSLHMFHAFVCQNHITNNQEAIQIYEKASDPEVIVFNIVQI
jgi:hypothetical protein